MQRNLRKQNLCTATLKALTLGYLVRHILFYYSYSTNITTIFNLVKVLANRNV